MLEKTPESNRAYSLAKDATQFLLDRLVFVPYVLDPYEPVEAYEQLTIEDFDHGTDGA